MMAAASRIAPGGRVTKQPITEKKKTPELFKNQVRRSSGTWCSLKQTGSLQGFKVGERPVGMSTECVCGGGGRGLQGLRGKVCRS